MAVGTEEEQQARRLKQAKIQSWLCRKEADEFESRRAEEDEARQTRLFEELKLQHKEKREAKEQRQKRCRLLAAARKHEEFVNEFQHACMEEGGPAVKASMASAVAAYGKPPRPVSARTRAR
jgi:hypothetical protein